DLGDGLGALLLDDALGVGEELLGVLLRLLQRGLARGLDLRLVLADQLGGFATRGRDRLLLLRQQALGLLALLLRGLERLADRPLTLVDHREDGFPGG